MPVQTIAQTELNDFLEKSPLPVLVNFQQWDDADYAAKHTALLEKIADAKKEKLAVVDVVLDPQSELGKQVAGFFEIRSRQHLFQNGKVLGSLIVLNESGLKRDLAQIDRYLASPEELRKIDEQAEQDRKKSIDDFYSTKTVAGTVRRYSAIVTGFPLPLSAFITPGVRNADPKPFEALIEETIKKRTESAKQNAKWAYFARLAGTASAIALMAQGTTETMIAGAALLAAEVWNQCKLVSPLKKIAAAAANTKYDPIEGNIGKISQRFAVNAARLVGGHMLLSLSPATAFNILGMVPFMAGSLRASTTIYDFAEWADPTQKHRERFRNAMLAPFRKKPSPKI